METNRRQCTAKSKQSGVRCKRRPIVGGEVCAMHGGKAPQVIAKARERLNALVDPAITALTAIINTSESEAIRLNAAKDILDRAGYKEPEKLVVSQDEEKPFVFTIKIDNAGQNT